MLERKIKLARMNAEKVSREICEFVINTVVNTESTGCVIGLSGGVDSTTTAALIKRAFDKYKKANREGFELVGYMLPSNVNSPNDTQDGIRVTQTLGIRYDVLSIDAIVEAYRTTNPEAFEVAYHKGNLISRIRANILSTKAATERKLVAGTGNKDEDFGIGYYTLFGDGAVHMSPIGALPKRLVREMAKYLGFGDKIVYREPTAGLEPEQTDFKDLGYDYDVVELVIEGLDQGLMPEELANHGQITPTVEKQIAMQEKPKLHSTREVVDDIIERHQIALGKAAIIHPPIAPITLEYN